MKTIDNVLAWFVEECLPAVMAGIIVAFCILLFTTICCSIEKPKFKDKIKYQNVDSTPCITADWIILDSSFKDPITGTTIQFRYMAEDVGTLSPGNIFIGNFIKTLKSLIEQIYQLQEYNNKLMQENQQINEQKEIMTENYYSLRKQIRDASRNKQ